MEIDPVLLFNLDDRSALALIRGSYSIAQNLSLDFGVRAAIRPAESEFSGLPTSAGRSTYASPPARVYARIGFRF